VTRFVAHGTGRTDTEAQVLILVGAAAVLVGGAIAATNGALRLLDILNDA
jgi:putative N-acetylmannosamine-6-phosphate epimerase